jgi:hypothetical protein
LAGSTCSKKKIPCTIKPEGFIFKLDRYLVGRIKCSILFVITSAATAKLGTGRKYKLESRKVCSIVHINKVQSN